MTGPLFLGTYLGPGEDGEVVEGGLRCPALSCEAPLVGVRRDPNREETRGVEVLLSCAGDPGRRVRHITYLTLSSSSGRVSHSISTHEISAGEVPQEAS